ncbi:MAG: four helix bundle protein [Prevotella sp.]|jgi:four helix bundle protein|uniref:four helix bundle protein n=1 Tax=Prevotella sp. Rep29 TaxID=2691580 RepID=UPI001C6EC21E|nr:four helix bundle protein [Prevotella sp. Rep29]MBQ3625080.1 four helix bundle protein [Prevotella sp.]MBR7014451.1 four helix bundle protein [Prevotella sp.]MBR7094508.1 four helix bundle protein [Prevotella sp.]QYR10781.1 four helix bundle protein [Prevotella sp. Rep29]
MKTIENNVYEITSEFAIRIVKLYKYLTEEKHEYIMSKQLFRSGTSIGANSFEGKNAQSRADFNSKMNIALKEATESGFWIDLLHKTEYLDETQYKSLYNDWNKIMGVLTKIVKATKK